MRKPSRSLEGQRDGASDVLRQSGKFWRILPAVLFLIVVLSVSRGSSSALASTSLPPKARPGAGPHTISTVPRLASYRIDARLDVVEKKVVALARITWTNPSSLPADALYFHAYLNAFENQDTLFLRKSGSRSGKRKGRAGKLLVRSLTSPRYMGRDLWPGENAHTPGDPKDRTDIRVPLPEPVGGNETLELVVEFEAHLPELVERTGFERDFFFVAQWFPKIAKRHPSGTWAHFPFHPNGEFFADFGNYEVSIDVPATFVVGSTGVLERIDGAPAGQQRYQARAQAVHDFAWTAWPGFVEETRKVGGVTVRLLRPPNTPIASQRTWRTVEWGLPFLGEAYGPYPYPSLTIVHPPRFAHRSGGMEYPQLITTGGSEIDELLGGRQLERVTIHELAHQWFQGMLASNEMECPFLDEGLTSYAEARYVDRFMGPGSAFDLSWFRVSRLTGARLFHFTSPSSHPITSKAVDFPDFTSIGSLVYARSSLGFETLSRVHGAGLLNDALAHYALRHRFTHPDLEDFYAALDTSGGTALARDARRIFSESANIDLSVDGITTTKVGARHSSTITLRSSGSLALPYEVLIRMTDGTSQRVDVSAHEDTTSLTVEHTSPIRSVHVDPAQKIMLDEDLTNNVKYPRGLPLRERFAGRAALLSLATWLGLVLSP